MADRSDSESQVRVVDRRWWARTDDADAADPAGDARGSRKPTYVEDLERQLADKNAQVQQMMTEHRRALDEFEQAKVRIRRDVAREVERGKRAVIVELLDVLDNLDRAIAAGAADSTSPLLKGVELVRDQFIAKLQSLGVSRIAALDEPFDANRHDAVSTAPVNDPARDGIVVAVLKEGYALGDGLDELLRPAAVVVGRFNG